MEVLEDVETGVLLGKGRHLFGLDTPTHKGRERRILNCSGLLSQRHFDWPLLATQLSQLGLSSS
jgi:hypothetical protein